MTDDEPPAEAWVADRLGVDPALVRERDGSVRAVVDLSESLPGYDGADVAATNVETAPDEEGALRHRFALPAGDGPLSLRVAVKANLAVAGVPTDCGADVRPVVPERSAAAVERLRDAGASVVATTTMDELAYAGTGTTGRRRVENPAAPDRVPGGSSAGSAAAVADGLVEAALGSDTAGSVRVPAAHCGVVGCKPTRGAVPREGLVDLSPSLDHVGVLARDVETAERALAAVRDPQPESPHVDGDARSVAAAGADHDVSLGSLHVGVVEQAIATADDAVRERFEAVTAALAAAGATVDRVTVPHWSRGADVVSVLGGAELAALVAAPGPVPGAAGGRPGVELCRRLRETGAYGPTVRAGLVAHGVAAARTAGQTYVRARAARRRIAERVETALADHDVLCTPTTPAPPPRREDADPGSLAPFANTAPLNCSGHPAVTVPMGRADGAPVGLQVVAPRGRDRLALSVGAAIEALDEP